MAELKVTADGFTLSSSWSCRVVYLYDSTGKFQRTYSVTQGTPSTVNKTVEFSVDLPTGSKINSAKIHANHTNGSWGGSFWINDITPDSNGFVTISNPTITNNKISAVFKWKATGHASGTSQHASDYPNYNGSSSQSVSKPHYSNSAISDIYILIEYQSGSIIYHAENGVLVPYQLFHAENGKLVPYQIQHGEGGKLVPY